MKLKASELIAQLQEQIAKHGDLLVFAIDGADYEPVDAILYDEFENGPGFFIIGTDPCEGF